VREGGGWRGRSLLCSRYKAQLPSQHTQEFALRMPKSRSNEVVHGAAAFVGGAVVEGAAEAAGFSVGGPFGAYVAGAAAVVACEYVSNHKR